MDKLLATGSVLWKNSNRRRRFLTEEYLDDTDSQLEQSLTKLTQHARESGLSVYDETKEA